MQDDEFEFVAVDRAGALAVFSTAGSGLVPRQSDDWFAATTNLMSYILGLPKIGEAKLKVAPYPKGDYSGLYRYSEAGMFAYDWHLIPGPYERLSAPEIQFPWSRLPAVYKSAVVRFEWLSFAASPWVYIGPEGGETDPPRI